MLTILKKILMGIYLFFTLVYFMMTSSINYFEGIMSFKFEPIIYTTRLVEVALWPLSMGINYVFDTQNNILRTGKGYYWLNYAINVDTFKNKERIFIYKGKTQELYLAGHDGDCRNSTYEKCSKEEYAIFNRISELIEKKAVPQTMESSFDGLLVKEIKSK